MTVPRRVWRAAPATLVIVVAFTVVAILVIPTLAVVAYRTRGDWPIPAVLATLALISLAYVWRFGLHPRIRADAHGLTVINPFSRARFDWAEVTVVVPGENGLLIAGRDRQITAWCVQKSNYATRRGLAVRADQVATRLLELADAFDPGAADDLGLRVRRARHDEVQRLSRLEQAASEASLAHIFPPEDYPYPRAEIAQRWRRMLRDPRVHVRLLDLHDAPIGYVAYDAVTGRVRRLGVVPGHRRQGGGRLLLAHACDEIFLGEAAQASGWILVDNFDGLAFAEEHGWSATGRERDCEFPPYPSELEYVLRRPHDEAAR